jgi:hypothetical protein
MPWTLRRKPKSNAGAEVVACAKCGCMAVKGMTKKVLVEYGYGGSGDEYMRYCARCRPRYDRVEHFESKPKYFVKVYHYPWKEVNEDGSDKE